MQGIRLFTENIILKCVACASLTLPIVERGHDLLVKVYEYNNIVSFCCAPGLCYEDLKQNEKYFISGREFIHLCI